MTRTVGFSPFQVVYGRPSPTIQRHMTRSTNVEAAETIFYLETKDKPTGHILIMSPKRQGPHLMIDVTLLINTPYIYKVYLGSIKIVAP